MATDAHAYAFIGLPAAGKSVALDVLYEQYGGRDVHEIDGVEYRQWCDEVSNFVRWAYTSDTGEEEVDDNELGRWAAEQKEEHGDDYFVRDWSNKTMGQHKRALDPQTDERPLKPIGLAGLRSPAELDAMRDVFDSVTAIVVWAKPDVRLNRKINDKDFDTNGEVEEYQDVFAERQKRELHDWGCKRFFRDEDYFDYIIPNNSKSEEQFRRDVRLCIEGGDFASSFESTPLPAQCLTDDIIDEYV